MNAASLLADLRARGVHLEPVGHKLRVVAPRGVLTAELQALLTPQKADLLAALQGRCSPACSRCGAGTVLLPDGCELHGVTAEDVARWWRVAQERDAEVSICHCCGGPAPSGALRCRRCEEPAS